MGKCIDLVGKKYGKLTVIEKTDKRTRSGLVIWKCECECGKIIETNTNSLNSGNTRSCGKCNKIENLIGEKFGRLTVIELDKTKSDEIKKAVWVCKCECGNLVSVRAYSLKRNQTKSCGCLARETASALLKEKYNDLKGKRFGKLAVIEKTNKRTSSGCVIWKCKCDCGNYTEVGSSSLNSGHTISCGCYTGSKGEEEIKNILVKHNINFQRQFTFNDLRGVNGGLLRFDFAIFKDDKVRCLIEYDGEQHYDKNNPYYHKEIETHDILKNKYCEKHNFKLYRIRYDENIEERVTKICLEMLGVKE